MAQLLGYLLTAGLLGSALFWVGCLATKGRAQAAPPDAGPDAGPADDARADTQRDRMRERLEALAQSAPPTDLQPIGAMCYEPMVPLDRAEYVCP